ncbi:MAG: prepilin-type N-terminal cleavage/methylation domain-containing protein [Tatlockia sp.]|jgi:type II secretory pathway component PulJ
MRKQQGFSFIENLIAIALLSSASLALLYHQIYISKALHTLSRTSLQTIERENHTEQQGMGLVELLISLFIGSLVLSLLMHQYLLGKTHYVQTNAQIEETVDLHMVSSFMRNSLRNAGFTPCRGISSLQTEDTRNGKSHLSAVESKGQSLSLNRMSGEFSTVIQQLSPNELLLRTFLPLKSAQNILIADCFHAEVQPLPRIQKTAGGAYLTLNKKLRFEYQPPIYVGEWIEEQFFIQKNSQGNPALFYHQKRSEELTETIRSLEPEISRHKGGARVTLKLGLKQGTYQVIETRVRNP